YLDRLALIHRPVTVGYPVEVRDPIEHTTRLDLTFENIGQQLSDIGAYRGRAAGDRDVVVERRLRRWNRIILGNADAAYGAAGTVSMRTSPAPYITVALMLWLPFVRHN